MKTKTYIEQCLERAEKATDGPWERNGVSEEPDHIVSYSALVGERCIADMTTWRKNWVLDAEFIAHARIDVPELALRLKEACDFLRYVDGTTKAMEFAEELEAPWEDK